MYDDRNHGADRSDGRALRRAGPFTVVLVIVALLAAACGGGSDGPGVANLGSSSHTSGDSSSNGATKADALAYSKCMRAHGITDFPDPNSKGQIAISAGPGSDLDPNSPRWQSAQEACKALAPSPGTPAQQAGRRAAALKYSKCMRKHGIADFPDPNSSGGLEVQATPGGDLDPNHPQFKAADQACKHLLPGGGKGGSLSESNEGAS
jgi:hypothetical protein